MIRIRSCSNRNNRTCHKSVIRFRTQYLICLGFFLFCYFSQLIRCQIFVHFLWVINCQTFFPVWRSICLTCTQVFFVVISLLFRSWIRKRCGNKNWQIQKFFFSSTQNIFFSYTTHRLEGPEPYANGAVNFGLILKQLILHQSKVIRKKYSHLCWRHFATYIQIK